MIRLKWIFFILLLNITLLSIAACNKAEDQMEGEIIFKVLYCIKSR